VSAALNGNGQDHGEPAAFNARDYQLSAPPVTAADAGPNPFNPEDYRLPPDAASEMSTKQLLQMLIRRPDKQSWVRVHPDYKFEAGFVDLKKSVGVDTYLLRPCVWGMLPAHETRQILYLAVDRFENAFLWPAKINLSGRENPWADSNAQAIEDAKLYWTMVLPGQGQYISKRAKVHLPDPVWPKEPWTKLLELAFRNGRIIDRADHPVIQQLLGLV